MLNRAGAHNDSVSTYQPHASSNQVKFQHGEGMWTKFLHLAKELLATESC